MTQLSPAYRNDPADGLSPQLQSYLDKQYLQKLPNLSIHHPKVLVVFSAGNAVGKSTLAQKIGTELSGLVLENDGVKRTLIKKMPKISSQDLNVFTWQYTMSLYQRLSEFTPNGLVVRDGVIDWYFDRILPVFEQQGYKLFIVAYELSRQKRTELITQRGDTPTTSVERLVSIMQDHDTHMARFRSQYKPNITLTDETLFNHDAVIGQLKKYIATL